MSKRKSKYIGSLFILIVMINGITLDVEAGNTDLSYMVLRIFSYTWIPGEGSFIELIYSIVHYIFTLYIFATFVSDEIKNKAIYIFTRTQRKDIWMIKVYGRILYELVIYYFVSFIFVIIGSYILGFQIFSIESFSDLIIPAILMNILTIYSLALVINTISMYTDNILAFVVGVFIYVTNILLARLASDLGNIDIIKFIPFSKNLVTITDLQGINRGIEEFSLYINGHTIYFDLVVLGVIIGVLIKISITRIKKMEFI